MVIMGVGLYWRLSSYFQTTTDLALKIPSRPGTQASAGTRHSGA